MPDVDAFVATIESGIPAAQAGYIVTFGVRPSFPSTAYGYIKFGALLDHLNGEDVKSYQVENFVEKPAVMQAQKMLLLS